MLHERASSETGTVPLTIAVPTRNRAAALRDQLEWITAAVRGHEDRCELLISDNASTDATSAVIDAWQRRHRHDVERIRQPHDVGAIANIAWCTTQARGRHVWVVGDDDHLDVGAVRFVLEHLAAAPELGVLALNFSSRHAVTGEQRFARCFEVDSGAVDSGGRALYERLLDHPDSSRWGGLMFTSALVMRSDLARAALQEWPAAKANFAMQLYLSAYCAAHQGIDVTSAVWLECASGTHYFVGDRANQARYQLGDVPAAMAALAELGYSPPVLRRRILAKIRTVGPVAVLTTPRWPARNARALVSCVRSLMAVVRSPRSRPRAL